MKKVAIFASGTGSNFEKIADDERLKDYLTRLSTQIEEYCGENWIKM